MYIEESIRHYLDDLASAQPAPGGGSASALSGAMGAALASMVCCLTQGKAGYQEAQDEIEHILEQTERLRTRFSELMQEDIAAYERLMAAYKMPRATDIERVERGAAIQEQLLEAALVPLEVVECAATLIQHCQKIAEVGNTSVLSDIVAASVLADASAGGAASMVRINLRSMKNSGQVSELEERLTTALQAITQSRLEVTVIVGRRA